YRRMIERVREVPGVIAAGAVRDLPFHGDGESVKFRIAGQPEVAPENAPSATLMFVSDGFFGAMGIPVVAGRDISPQDRQGTAYAFVVNQAFAKAYLDGKNPVGQMLTFGDTTRYPIVGMVGDVRQSSVDETPVPRVYISVYQVFRVRT